MADELTKRSGELKAQADLVQKQAMANPSDLAVAKNADDKRLLADRERQLASDAKKAFDEVQASFLA